jgi:hypothetical protein
MAEAFVYWDAFSLFHKGEWAPIRSIGDLFSPDFNFRVPIGFIGDLFSPALQLLVTNQLHW